MNVVFVLLDSVNRQDLQPYGGPAGVTPNLARLADNSVRFDNHFVGSLPCMPARREIFTGRKDFLWRPWGHLEPFDVILPRVAANHGYKTMLITDHYHYWEENANGYMESFQGLQMIRGYENDNWNVDPVDDVPEWVKAIDRYRPGWGTRYYRNVRDFHDERDFFSAKVFGQAAQWVENNYGHGNFFLQVESFGAHEPFHVPEPYRSMWTQNTDPSYNLWPPYQDPAVMQRFFADTSAEELDFIRGQYFGKLSMLDHWLGEFLDTLDRLQVWDDTMLVVTTDHGHELGQRGTFAKSYPHYDSHANIPLLVRHPKGGGARDSKALTSTVDLNATLIEAMGVGGYSAPHSRSFLPVILGQRESHRSAVLYGTYGQGAGVTDGETVLLQGFDNTQHPLYLYSTRIPALPMPGRGFDGLELAAGAIEAGRFIPGVDLPVWRIPWKVGGAQSGPSVVYRRSDPLFAEENRLQTDPGLTRRMRDLLHQVMEDEGTPAEQYVRLGLSQ